MSYSDDETIVCEFLRKISPSREWEYLGEIEHCWIGELCDAIRERESKENAKLRKLVVLGIMLPLNEEQLDLLDKTFVSELGEGLYVQLEKLGIEVN